MATTKPTLEVRELKDGSAYYVLVTWPDGMEQQVNGFSNREEAHLWIEHDSDAWLARHPRSS